MASVCFLALIKDYSKLFSGRYVKSGELVPGDVYEVTDPSLTQFPCDSLLLAGDCIVNESMLTGKIIGFKDLGRANFPRGIRPCLQGASYR